MGPRERRPTVPVLTRLVLVVALVSVVPTSTGDAHPRAPETPGAIYVGQVTSGPFVCEID